jgi:hypothetical protein
MAEPPSISSLERRSGKDANLIPTQENNKKGFPKPCLDPNIPKLFKGRDNIVIEVNIVRYPVLFCWQQNNTFISFSFIINLI